MSIGRILYLSCNGPQNGAPTPPMCQGVFEAYEVDQTAAQVRRDARKSGWRNRGKTDICPRCVQTEQVERPQ